MITKMIRKVKKEAVIIRIKLINKTDMIEKKKIEKITEIINTKERILIVNLEEAIIIKKNLAIAKKIIKKKILKKKVDGVQGLQILKTILKIYSLIKIQGGDNNNNFQEDFNHNNHSNNTNNLAQILGCKIIVIINSSKIISKTNFKDLVLNKELIVISSTQITTTKCHKNYQITILLYWEKI